MDYLSKPYLKPVQYAELMQYEIHKVWAACRENSIEGVVKVGREYRIPNPHYQREN